MRRSRAIAGRLAPSLTLAFLGIASGCTLLLDADAHPDGPCGSSADCPALQTCIDTVCRTGVEEASTPSDTGSPGPANDASPSTDGSGDAAASSSTDGSRDAAASSSTDGSGDAGCPPACNPLLSACIAGTCRALFWASPQSNSLEPSPEQVNNRSYAPVGVDMIYAQRIQVAYSGTVIRLGVLLSGALLPTTFRIGLYGGEGSYPQGLLADSGSVTSVMDLNGSGRLEAPVTPVHLAAGTYWIAIVSQQRDLALQSAGSESQTDTAEVAIPGDAGDPLLDPFPSETIPGVTVKSLSLIAYAVLATDST